MVAPIMSSRCIFMLAAMFVVLSGLYARADDSQTAVSDTVYERNSRWVIVTDRSGTTCDLVIPYGNKEVIHILIENKLGILKSRFLFLKKNLKISISGKYDMRLEFEDGLIFMQRAEAYEVDEYSGVIADFSIQALAEELSKNRTLNLKVGEVSYGNYDLTFLRAGLPRLYDCLMDTTKWDVTASLSLRKQLSP